MTKTAKLKKRTVTPHSRAARRAASPSLNLNIDKPAQKTSQSPSHTSTLNPHALAAKDAGIIKKQKKGSLTRAQRLRQQKGVERAAHTLDKLAVKREKSSVREKKVKERSKGWEEVNGGGGGAVVVTGKMIRAEGEKNRGVEEAAGWVSDEDMEEEAKSGDTQAVVESTTLTAEEDELL